jgi:hypothetical protein
MAQGKSLVSGLSGMLLLLAMGLPARSFAGDAHCDPALVQPREDAWGYRLRDDRCEGTYAREVAGRSLRVVSLTESFEDYDPASTEPVLLEWAVPGGAGVRLRAQALRHRLYYRMDTVRPARTTSYQWPPALLGRFNLRRHELGVVAWMTHDFGAGSREVYLPLRISQRTAPRRSDGYRLLLVPGVELLEVFITLTSVGPDGRAGPGILTDHALAQGYYPAERPIAVILPRLKTDGVYSLDIGATVRGGGSAALRVWLYHAGA